jgi:CxxC motif-containing protein (DUF1111 family)
MNGLWHPSLNRELIEVRNLRPRLMHDGASLTLLDAITRHSGEAGQVVKQFEKLKRPEQNAIIEFLKSL